MNVKKLIAVGTMTIAAAAMLAGCGGQQKQAEQK